MQLIRALVICYDGGNAYFYAWPGDWLFGCWTDAVDLSGQQARVDATARDVCVAAVHDSFRYDRRVDGDGTQCTRSGSLLCVLQGEAEG